MVICSAKTSDEYYKALNDHLNMQTSRELEILVFLFELFLCL